MSCIGLEASIFFKDPRNFFSRNDGSGVEFYLLKRERKKGVKEEKCKRSNKRSGKT